MNKKAVEFFKKLECVFGTRKLIKSACIAGAVLLICLAELPDDQEMLLTDLENNKNNIKGE
jgi:hypothetical protein